MKSINILSLAFILLVACQPTKQEKESKAVAETEVTQKSSYVIEITRFKIKEEVDQTVFTQRDSQIEEGYTSKQRGFIRRESGLADDGEWLVVVYWETLESADASMQKFMGDTSVADYASMIDGPTMKMKRYVKEGEASKSKNKLPYIIEVTTFQSKEDVNADTFAKRDSGIETDYTSKQSGFIARESAMAEDGEWVVVVYWQTMTDADASMQKFMTDTSVADYAAMINPKSMTMARYSAKN